MLSSEGWDTEDATLRAVLQSIKSLKLNAAKALSCAAPELNTGVQGIRSNAAHAMNEGRNELKDTSSKSTNTKFSVNQSVSQSVSHESPINQSIDRSIN